VAREAWELELDRLREAYRRELPEKLAGLAALLRAARQSRDPASLADALREAHSLKGSSGSYGFTAACRELQDIEDGLASLQQSGSAGPADPWPALEHALGRARDTIPAA
jgi:chemotaxis protein histidine kinase CheA